ncbi:uncharacterized protein LOC133313256 [Gastrolobium bilobum]|uniref:uncharacterized protein LOC133313256 n=1 Tax=Gastrolobium bilobum TaxID=150636 RepID=UPI002AB1F32D|nr:uncharacterized protein LOC133313256 [Gastrolobium bilobum]
MSDGMQCIDHPHRNNTSGICAFCLQDKLGKLVSSSFPSSFSSSSSSSSSSSPSFRSHTAYSITTAASAPPPATSSSSSSSYSSLSLSVPPTSAKKNGAGDHDYYMRSLLPFLVAKKNKKNKPSTKTSSSSSDIIFKRSKSSATQRRDQFVDDEDFSPRKRNGFWSFLYLSSKPSASSSSSCSKKFEGKSFSDINGSTRISTGKQRDKCLKSDMVVEEDAFSLERKVSRSRSVGCGSRSFSGDFFERISTGLGDCTLRRVESQREGNKPKVAAAAGGAAVSRGGDHHHHNCMKERVKCGGIFGGFMMMTSSSSSLSCSSYWVSSSADDSMNGESSWGWAFASPMRVFSNKTSSKENKRDGIRDASDNNATPNLSAIPSLLTVTG